MKLNFWPILNSNSIPLSSENCLSISHAEIVMKIVIRYTYSLLIPLPADDQYFKHLFFLSQNRRCCTCYILFKMAIKCGVPVLFKTFKRKLLEI